MRSRITRELGLWACQWETILFRLLKLEKTAHCEPGSWAAGKGERELSTNTYHSLLCDCSYNVTSCLQPLPLLWLVSCCDGLYSGTVSQTNPLSLTLLLSECSITATETGAKTGPSSFQRWSKQKYLQPPAVRLPPRQHLQTLHSHHYGRSVVVFRGVVIIIFLVANNTDHLLIC